MENILLKKVLNESISSVIAMKNIDVLNKNDDIQKLIKEGERYYKYNMFVDAVKYFEEAESRLEDGEVELFIGFCYCQIGNVEKKQWLNDGDTTSLSKAVNMFVKSAEKNNPFAIKCLRVFATNGYYNAIQCLDCLRKISEQDNVDALREYGIYHFYCSGNCSKGIVASARKEAIKLWQRAAKQGDILSLGFIEELDDIGAKI